MNDALAKPLSESQRTWNEIKHEIGMFADFVRKPRRTVRREKKWLSRFLLLWGLCLAVAILQIPLELGFEQFAPSIKYNLNTDTKFILMAVFMAPVVEELAFRAGLRSARYTLLIGPALFVIARADTASIALAVTGGFVLVALLDWLYRSRLARPGLVMRRGRAFLRRYPLVVWTYAAAFAIIHVGNFDYSPQAAFLMPLMLLPQLFCGLVFSYLRIRHGLIYSMLLHAAYNASLCSVLLLG